MKIPNTIFKTYDIRGIVGNELNNALIRDIGKVFGIRAQKRGIETCVIGRDGRESGSSFADSLSNGLRMVGINVIDIGMVPTPMVYFATHYFKNGTGIVITGSHNPSEYNGLKMMLAGKTLWGNEILDLRNDLKKLTNMPNFISTSYGDYKGCDIFEEYRKEILGSIKLSRPLNIAIDAGNGVAGQVAKNIFKSLGCDVVDLYCEVNGTFPNHHPDPADPKNLTDLIHTVCKYKLDFGLAFDGDGDRLGVISKSGKIIWPDRQLMLHAKEVLKKSPGSQIIFDVKCSRHVAEWIERHGGCPVMWKTGHSLIKAKLKETNAPLAGEMSGHIFFNDRWFGFDDAIYAGARLIEVLSKKNEPGKYLDSLPESVSTPELKYKHPSLSSVFLVESVKSDGVFPTAKKFISIDGIRVEYDDGFGLARSSNTTPVVVFRFEANNEESLTRIKNEFRKVFLSIDSSMQLPF